MSEHIVVYLVCCSNCELWSDYHWWVDAAFTTREKAVAYIEGEKDMRQVDWAREDRKWSRDVWEKEINDYEREDAWIEGKELR